MKDLRKNEANYSGRLLVAHPEFSDQNFNRTVILISEHKREGTFGVVINRPLNKLLGEFSDEFAYGPLAAVPLFSGGPVGIEQLILTAWKWEEGEGAFKVHFGVTADKVELMLTEEPDLEIRGFLGYAGWREGQIEQELEQKAWVVSPIDGQAIKELKGRDLWREVLTKVSPELEVVADLLAEAPDDVTLN